jgi:hypothetical protein
VRCGTQDDHERTRYLDNLGVAEPVKRIETLSYDAFCASSSSVGG